MHINTYLYTYFFGKYVGQDKFGNSYYRSKINGKSKKEKRWVLYKGVIEASKIPPAWHRWIHHTTDKLPTETSSEDRYIWQKRHQANFTGTDYAYKPVKTSYKKHIENNKSYEAWQPNHDE